MAKKTKAADTLLRQIKELKRKLKKSDLLIKEIGEKQTELKVRADDFTRLIESSHDVIYRLDVKSRRYIYVSPSCLPVYGIPERSFLKKTVSFLKTRIHRDDRTWLGAHIRDIMLKKGKGSKNFRVEYRIIFRNDEEKWIVDRHTVFYDVKGNPQTIIGSVRDVTFTKNTQEELTRSYNLQKEYLNLLLSIQNALPAPISLLDKDGNIISVNSVWEKHRGKNPYFGLALGIGTNYLKAFDALSKKGSSSGKETASGLRKLLRSELDEFSEDYSVDSGGGKNWYRMLAKPINRKRREGAVVMHINITETKTAQETLTLSEKHYRALFEENPVPILVYDFETLKILSVNESAVQFYGYSRDEFVKMSTLQIRPIEDIDSYIQYRKDLYEKGLHNMPLHAGIWTHKKKNGEIFKVEVIRRVIEYEGKDAVLALINDVTGKIKTVEELERRNKEISRMYEVEKQLSSTLEPSVIYDKIYHIISELMACDSMIISSFNKEDNMIKCLSVWADGSKIDLSDFPLIPLAPEGHGIQSPVIRSGKPKIILNYKTEFLKSKYQITRSSSPLPGKQIELYSSAVMIPLKLEGEVIGTLQVLSRKKDAYGEEDLRILEAISAHISAATANALLYQQAQNEISERTKAEQTLKKRTEEISLLYDSYIELTSTLEPSVIYEKVYHILCRIMPCDAMMISSYDDVSKMIKPVSLWQDAQKLEAEKLPSLPANSLGEGTQSRVIISGEPLMLNDYAAYIDKVQVKFIVNEKGTLLPNVPDSEMVSRSALLVPMKIENKVIGVITVFSYKKDSYSPENLSMLQALSTQLSAATVNAMLYQQAQSELRQRIKSEEELKINKEKLENAQLVANLGSWELDNATGEIFLSDELFRICGVEKTQKRYDLQSAVDMYHPDEREDILRSFYRIKDEGGPVTSERRILRPDGSVRFVRLHTGAVRGLNGKITGYIGTVHDITGLKQINQELVKSLEEKELMLKEIHHRVKNNLQVVSSLLRMQSETVTDKSAIEHLKISEQRVKSMALIHQQLYKTQDLSRINFRDYVNELCMYLYHAYTIRTGKVDLSVDVSDISFGIDTALPCGLIINELITNSLKHAFPGDMTGKVEIKLYKNDEGKNILIVKDNGIGMKKDYDADKAGTLGMKLVKTLTEQLEGELQIIHEGGLEVKITFDDLIYKHRI